MSKIYDLVIVGVMVGVLSAIIFEHIRKYVHGTSPRINLLILISSFLVVVTIVYIGEHGSAGNLEVRSVPESTDINLNAYFYRAIENRTYLHFILCGYLAVLLTIVSLIEADAWGMRDAPTLLLAVIHPATRYMIIIVSYKLTIGEIRFHSALATFVILSVAFAVFSSRTILADDRSLGFRLMSPLLCASSIFGALIS